MVVAARDEQARIGATLAALSRAFPASPVWVADDGSRDATAAIARAAGARVVAAGARRGKGAAVSGALELMLAELAPPAEAIVVLCDADLGDSAAALGRLVDALVADRAQLAVAVMPRAGGGFGLVRRLASLAIRRRRGVATRAPICGQRALRAGALRAALPFADGFGMELAMTLDVLAAGHGIVEVDVELSHRDSGRGPAGFAHRARQLRDILRAYRSRAEDPRGRLRACLEHGRRNLGAGRGSRL